MGTRELLHSRPTKVDLCFRCGFLQLVSSTKRSTVVGALVNSTCSVIELQLAELRKAAAAFKQQIESFGPATAGKVDSQSIPTICFQRQFATASGLISDVTVSGVLLAIAA
jgi:hypothetical protein